MFRAYPTTSRVDRVSRLLAPLLAVVLGLSVGAVAPATAAAAGSGSVAALRHQQVRAERDMRRADMQIARLSKQRGSHARLVRLAKAKLSRAIERRRTAERKADTQGLRLHRLKLTLARETLVRPNPAGNQKVDKPKLRRQVRAQESAARQLGARLRKAEKVEASARALKRSRLGKPSQARIEARKGERERAEARLGSAIVAMVTLSKERAGALGTASVNRFSRPARAKISQGFGCTGIKLYAPGGGCAHFHDGVDIAAPKGTRVRASAAGYVAYVGFSPWDDTARAFVVIIGHAGGYESVYAHMQPRHKVRAGQKVDRGDVIGTVGVTGLTSGPHVHWEVKAGGINVNPLRAAR